MSLKLLKNGVKLLSAHQLEKIKKFKNKHLGEDCYIIGDGVSIKWFELNQFSNKIAISASSLIPFHNSFSDLNLRYAMVPEPYWFYPGFWTKYITRSVSMPEIQRAYRSIIKKNLDTEFFINLSNYPILKNTGNINYLFHNFPDKFFGEQSVSYGFNPFAGGLTGAVSLAIYMGFDSIFLVGCDYTHIPSRSLHWYESGPGILTDHPHYNRNFFQFAQKQADITTVTLDGSSEYLKSIKYQDFTGVPPAYKENTKLLSDQYLKILASYSGYKIR